MLSLVSDAAGEIPTPTGTQLRETDFYSHALARDVAVSVLLPPGFNSEASSPYPVLYLNDGQDLPRLQLQTTLDQLFAHQLVQPFVVIAPHANERRTHEYGIAAQADYNGRGSLAAAYTDFVLNELVPHAREYYHVSADPAESIAAGFSLGGLMAFDMVWHHPTVFQRAGVFSGSFWWRSRAVGEGYTPADRIMHELVRTGQLHSQHSFWLQTGTLDERGDRNENGVIDSLEDSLDIIEELIAKGLDAHRALRYVQIEGGHHHPDTWGRIMPDFLRWAFGQPNTPPLPAPLPIVRLQFDPDAAPSILLPTASAPAASLPVVAPVEVESALIAVEANNTTTSTPSFINNLMNSASTLTTRPVDGDYLPYAVAYIDLLPAGTNPVEALREQASEVQRTFGSLSDEQALLVYAPEKWTSKQILLHLVDAERIFAYRALRFARGDGQSLPGFEENDYAAASGANSRPMKDLLAEYAAVRTATLALFDSFTDEQLERRGLANGAPTTVLALVYITAGHERHHLAVFEERYRPML